MVSKMLQEGDIMNMNNTCILKDCRLRICLKELPESERDYSENYPYNVYGIRCDAPCSIRLKVLADKEEIK